MSSAEFYDNFISSQVKSGINDRIAGLYERMCRLGLDTNSTVLEIGCGIGTLTYLLLKKIKSGKVEGIDISPKSIEFAQQHLKAANLSLTAADIPQFEPQSKQFDRITLFDVLEHIPLEQHAAVFQRISKWMRDDSLLLINIPNPGYILYDQKNNPAALQETDQPVFLAPLTAAFATASLDIVQMETYSVWVKDDYQFMVVRKRKMKRKWRKLQHRYPPKQ
jgi:trans-aconitate 2-methyltransferase